MKKQICKAVSLAACLGIAVSLAGCSAAADPKADGAFVSVGGTPVSYDEFRYYFLSTKDMMSQSSDSDSSATNLDLPSLLTQVESNLQNDHGLDAWASSVGVELTDEDKAELDSYTEYMVQMAGGEDAFADWLGGIYCTPDLYRSLNEKQILQQKALEKWFNDNYAQSVVDSFEGNTDYVHVQHVLITFDDTAEGADHSAELATANEVYQKAVAGEDFESLIEEYNEDPGQANDMHGYMFTADDSYVQEFKDASFALEEGGISEPVETSYGYHIIKRLPIDLDYVRENAMNLAPEDVLTQAQEALQADLDSRIAEMTITQGDCYDKLTIDYFDDTIPTPSPAPSSDSASASQPDSAAQSDSTAASDDSAAADASSASSAE